MALSLLEGACFLIVTFMVVDLVRLGQCWDGWKSAMLPLFCYSPDPVTLNVSLEFQMFVLTNSPQMHIVQSLTKKLNFTQE